MIEQEHDDVKRLSERMERRWDERDQERRREALKKERDVDDDTPAAIFFCDKCRVDYRPKIVMKQVEEDWNTGGYFRYWKSKHSCGTWNKRLITDRHKDKFWILSPSVKRQRAYFKEDMLQPQDSGFNMLYGRKRERQEQVGPLKE